MADISTRVSFLIDGFNFYHSLRKTACSKWFDLNSLCDSQLHLFTGKAELEEIYYFSALATHLKPKDLKHHKIYIDALKTTDIIPVLGKFKKKDVFCHACKKSIEKHEEKQTDVSIAVKILELFHRDKCDSIGIVSCDTDLIPAIKTAQNLFPHKEIIVFFPKPNNSKELKTICKCHKLKQYDKHVFPDTIVHKGNTISKPPKW